MIIDRKHFDINNRCVIDKITFKTPFKMNSVFQDEACFIFIKEGEVHYNSPTESLSIQTSESILLKCSTYFATFIEKLPLQTCEIFAIHLYPEMLKDLYKDEFPSFLKKNNNKPFAHKIDKKSVITHFIDSMDFYFENPALVTEDLLKLKIKELILLLLQTQNAENIIAIFSNLFNPQQATLNEIIQAHLFSTISVNELAALSGRSLSAFKRDFEVQFHNTPANYLKEKKLDRALELIQSTTLAISEICYRVGFNDTSHFTKIFKQKYNQSPSKFRKK